jgi:hypothetical protein
MRLVAPLRDRVIVHVDLHETTDSDETEYRPALAARDGTASVPGEISGGFYLVADSAGQIIGSPTIAPGIIAYPVERLGLCLSMAPAAFRTITEVYPDSPRATPEQCIVAQVTAARSAIAYALRHRTPARR